MLEASSQELEALPSNEYHFIYHFITQWRVQGTVDAVYDLISHPLDYPRWWPSVYLKISAWRQPQA